MERRYHALRTIGNIYRVLGYIVLVLTVLAVIAICGLSVLGGSAINSITQQYSGYTNGSGLVGGLFGGVIASILVIIYGGLVGLSLIAFGEGIYLLIAVEENTRKTAILFENQNKITPSAPQT
jgi:uncharacterized membrane protein